MKHEFVPKKKSQDEYDKLAPNTEYEDAVDMNEAPNVSDDIALYLPEKKVHENYDIDIEFNTNVTAADTEVRVRRLPDADFYSGVRALNEQQREFFADVLQRIRDECTPFNVFLSGGARVGKSHLVRMLYQALDREFTRQPGDEQDSIKLLLCAIAAKLP